MTNPEFYTLLDRFIAVLERETAERVSAELPRLQEFARKDGRREYYEYGYTDGKRFAKVWDAVPGKSVRYFVEKSTGIIFGASSWSQYNPRRTYGTLSTIDEWEWGNYDGYSKRGVSTLVPKSMRR